MVINMKLKDQASVSLWEDPTLRNLLRNSQTGCVVVDCLSSDTTEASIIETLRALYDVPGETVTRDVAIILQELRRLGALEE